MKGRMKIDMTFIKRAKERDNGAWEHIMEISRGAVRRFIKQDLEALDEVVSNTVAKLMEQIDTYDPQKGRGNIEANFKKWINTTAELEVIHWRERNKLREERHISLEELGTSIGLSDEDEYNAYEAGEGKVSFRLYSEDERSNPEIEYEKKEAIEALMAFGDTKAIEAMILHYLYGHTIREIAETLGEKESTVNNWIHRSKEQLRKLSKETGTDRDQEDGK